MIVKKYGGSSLANEGLIKKVAKDIIKTKDKQIVVVSAPYGMTNKLISAIKRIDINAPKREIDQMLVTGEMINASLLSSAINALGVKSTSRNAFSLGIYSDNNYLDGKINYIDKDNILKLFEEYDVIVVTGFQGCCNNDFVSLGRGGSDTTALALASLFNARCIIYTDVEGVYTIDPKYSNNYNKLKSINSLNMLDLSLCGSKVLSAKSANILHKYNVSTKIVKSLSNDGTKIEYIEEYGPKAISTINLSVNDNDKLFLRLNNKSFYKDDLGNFSGICIVGEFMLKTGFDKKISKILKKYKVFKKYIMYKENLFIIIVNNKKSKSIYEEILNIINK